MKAAHSPRGRSVHRPLVVVEMIRVSIRNPSNAGRLYPRLVNMGKDRWLVVESRIPRAAPYGLDIDATVACDIDADRVLMNVDLQAGMRRWHVAPLYQRPPIKQYADLGFTEATLRQGSFPIPVSIRTDAERSYALVTWGSATGELEAVGLSEHCLALVSKDILRGFYIDVPTLR